MAGRADAEEENLEVGGESCCLFEIAREEHRFCAFGRAT